MSKIQTVGPVRGEVPHETGLAGSKKHDQIESLRKGNLKMAVLRPLEDRVVVEQIQAEEKTAGGIVLPDTAKEKPQRGTVIAVGPGKLLESGDRAAVGVVVGDEVLFGKYSGTDVKVAGKEVKILRESDILAKVVN